MTLFSHSHLMLYNNHPFFPSSLSISGYQQTPMKPSDCVLILKLYCNNNLTHQPILTPLLRIQRDMVSTLNWGSYVNQVLLVYNMVILFSYLHQRLSSQRVSS